MMPGRVVGLWIVCAGLVACSKPVIFEGDTTITVIGERPGKATDRRLELRHDTIVVKHGVEFERDDAIAPSSFELLDELATLLKQRPEAKWLVFETCAISAARSRSLLAYLVDRGAPSNIRIAGAPTEDDRSASEPAAGGEPSSADDDTGPTR